MDKSYFICNFFLICLLTFSTSNAYVDLFLDSNETQTLLGSPGKFFYVFGGELRQNSISYIIEIPFSKDTIAFNWKTSSKNLVKYKLNLTGIKNTLSIDSTGIVPNYLSSFTVQFNCSNTSKSDINFVLNGHFEMIKNNNLQQANDIQQLFTMPPLNFSIQYRKNCMFKNPYNNRLNNNSNNNFAVAYIIIGVLFGFAFLFASSGIIMFFHNKLKHRRLHAKYESLHARLNKQQQEQLNSHTNNEKLNNQIVKNNNMYTKNVQMNNNRNNRNNLYTTKKSKQIETRNDSSNEEQQQNQNEETQNIYESVQESSVNITNQNNEEQQSMLPRKTSRHLLNLTTNTIQSVYNNTNTVEVVGGRGGVPTSSSNLLIHRSSASTNKNSIEMCVKYSRDQIELNKILMEGTFSRIYEGRLLLSQKQNENDNDSPSDKDNNKVSTAAAGAYDNFDTANIYKLNNSQSSGRSSRNRLSRCLKFDTKEEEDDDDNGYIKVLIKTVNNNASLEQTDMMLKESCVFRGLKHKNLNSIIGLCIEPDSHTLALFPFNEMGNLKMYLNSIRELKLKEPISLKSTNKNENALISTQEILYIVLQMLKALNYLHGKRIVHKDIATRNCWLDGKFSVKLSDSALSRDLFPDDYHCLANNENRPIFWMSIESLKENCFNNRSDIWSAGVFAWECFSLGAQPYADQIDPFDFLSYLTESEMNRLQRPAKCPTELYDIYSTCWNVMPNLRPSLKEIFYSMHKLYSTYDNYI